MKAEYHIVRKLKKGCGQTGQDLSKNPGAVLNILKLLDGSYSTKEREALG